MAVSPFERNAADSIINRIYHEEQLIYLDRLQCSSQLFNTLYLEMLERPIIYSALFYGMPMTDEFRQMCRSVYIGVSNIPDFLDGSDRWKRHFAKPKYLYKSFKIGERFESKVIDWVERKVYGGQSFQVFRPKIILNPNAPILSAIPDGILCFRNNAVALLEIKSVAHVTSFELLNRPPLLCRRGKLICSRSSRTYTQIQLSLFVSNLPKCLLVVHLPDAEKGPKNKSIWIKSNKLFIKKTYSDLTYIFRKEVFPYIESKSEIYGIKPFQDLWKNIY